MVQTYGCSSLCQMYRNERQCSCIEGVTSLLWLIVSIISKIVITWVPEDFMGWTMAVALLQFMFVPAYTFILKLLFTNSICLRKELHNLKAVIFLQTDNWVITSFFSKEGENLTSLILLKGRLKGKKVISAVGWAFSILLFSTSCCWYPLCLETCTKHSPYEAWANSELHLWHFHSIVTNHKWKQ